MTWATPTNDQPSVSRGEVRFVGGGERAELEAVATSSGLLLVPIEPPRPALRGRLALLIESAVEEQLERRGAPPPGVGASSDLDASLSDQLYRARLVGSQGLAISLHTVEGIANLAGAIDAEDSAVLRWWVAATHERPVHLYLADADRSVGVYGEPVALASLLGGDRCVSLQQSSPNAAPEVRHSTATMELSEVPPSVAEIAARIVVREEREPTPSPAPVTCAPVNDAEALMQAMAAIFADEGTPSEGVPSVTEEAPGVFAVDAAPVEPAESVDPTEAFATEAPSEDVGSMAPPPVEPFCSPPTPEAIEVEPSTAAPEPEPQPEPQPEPAAKKSHPPLDPNAALEWRRWVQELESTRGPKPLAVIERTFVSAYVPLSDALARGVAGEEAAPVALAWAKSFERSYSEAFDALRVRGKRPTMVLDVPDLALRIGRLHGARSAQLILVDGMRFDLGLRVNERLRPLLGQHAALTERLLLWSALPSTTAMQLELIGRGAQGLKEVTGETDSEIPVARGRAATTLRRIRAGQREVLKLDLVESAMSVPGGPLAERLDDLADEAAEALAGHLLRLPPRTLALVFGDHGFTLDPVGGGTSAGHSGGASPEEVLVPAFAWLVGSVH
ncbi:MAG: hypothetical protein IPM35_29560 [Myxococcales bacterium]|nr:hypothetical protein [Myxococcales bacterium]